MKRFYLWLVRLVSEPRSWFRATTRRHRLELEMEAELASHLEFLTGDLIRAGHPPAEAGRRARIALGSTVVHKDRMRASLGLRLWDDLCADLRYASRRLRGSPGFTLIATLSLALTIGANTTIFSLAKQMLYARLAVPHPEGLRMLRWNGRGNMAIESMWGDFDLTPGGGMTGSVFSDPVYEQLRAHNAVMGDLLAFKEDSMNATIRGEAQTVPVAMVSGNYFSVLQVPVQLGRTIEPADDAVPGSGTVAVISDGLWARAFDRSPSVLGQTIKLNQAMFTVVGVSPRGFSGAQNVQSSPDLFVPLAMQPVVAPKRGTVQPIRDPQTWWLNLMGRVKPGVADQQAQTALDVQLSAATRATMTVKADQTIPKMELADGSRGLHYADHMFKKPVYVLMTFTGFVLLLACANIANLLLARGTQRSREMSVRLALGAGRERILRQLLTESLLLAVLGGLAGLLLGYLGRNAIPSLLHNPWEPNEMTTPFDWGVFAFTGAVTMLTGILFGLAPAWLAGRTEGSSLKETAQTATRRRKGLAGKGLVAFQIALSTLLVVGAGLFLRSLLALNAVHAGFDTDHLLLFEINPPGSRYPAGKDIELHRRLEQAVSELPGVERVSTGALPYLSGNMAKYTFYSEGESNSQNRDKVEFFNAVGNSFFQTMGISIVAGRSFGAQDTPSSAKVAVINEGLARSRFPGLNPIGRRFRMEEGPDAAWIQIVGVCRNTRYMSLRSDAPPQFFVPYVQQKDAGGMVYQVRTHQATEVLVPGLRRVVQSIDPDLPIVAIRTQREQIEANMQIERAFASLTVGFGALALALACVGIYGVMAYSVANRTNEIGIRLALGAQPGQVLSMILREATWISLAGVAAGLTAALLLAQAVKSMLYGLRPADPISLIAGAGLLIAVGLAASWLPARRAAGVQPMEALRHE